MEDPLEPVENQEVEDMEVEDSLEDRIRKSLEDKNQIQEIVRLHVRTLSLTLSFKDFVLSFICIFRKAKEIMLT